MVTERSILLVQQVKPCPCCEGGAQIHRIPTWTDGGLQYTYCLSCLDCGHGPRIAHKTEMEAIAYWNEEATAE